uniref:NADH-ubiquinone oxidoreductase chain 5 n=1 Tax=Scotoplanes sp. TT-2017 TaxID=1979181 RepID=A0A3G9GU80_9ECHN|nr:NADH dehydrogenase subunit 5 [Scotoplanes sp. TT-2017]
MYNLSLISLFITLLTFFLLTTGLFLPNNPLNTPSIYNNNNYLYLNIMKFLSFISFINIIIFSLNPFTNIVHITEWFPTFINNNFSIFLDLYFIFFSSTAIIVSWSIVEFSIYYLNTDPFSNSFFRLLFLFILNMLILTSANNLFLFFIGWEGVGFLSFLLISWWISRQNANNAAIQAIIYNRIGDIGILILIVFILINSNSWDLLSISTFWNILSPSWKNFIFFSILLAAIGKSAQFGLHPWLPSAMEGPTPVSALLHSSTMVVAGIFLLVRTTSLINPTPLFLSICLILGSLTSIFAATSAIMQHDIKKIIAYSTTSQLGLMVISIGLNQPLLAIFHICTHAFFKAMLFLCSGSIIHSFNNEQDLRKIWNLNLNLPITSACLSLGSLALMGIPFLSGFYSKDLILENLSHSPINIISFILIFMSISLTVIYSFRIFIFSFNSTGYITISPINEENNNLINPLLRLGFGSIFIGWFIISINFNENFLFTLPILKLIIPLILICSTLYSNIVSTNTVYSWNNIFFSNSWFFQFFCHSQFNKNLSNLSLLLSNRTFDRGWLNILGPQNISNFSYYITQSTQLTQSGYINQYLLSFILIFSSISLVFFLI